MIEEYSRHGIKAIGVAVGPYELMGCHLGDGIGADGIEERCRCDARTLNVANRNSRPANWPS